MIVRSGLARKWILADTHVDSDHVPLPVPKIDMKSACRLFAEISRTLRKPADSNYRVCSEGILSVLDKFALCRIRDDCLAFLLENEDIPISGPLCHAIISGFEGDAEVRCVTGFVDS
jgi:hypothetical protein